jgi:hypothetical protein
MVLLAIKETSGYGEDEILFYSGYYLDEMKV